MTDTSDNRECESSFDTARLPRLMADRGFWGMTTTQFLGAFNDNLFKQLMLLLAIQVSTRDLQPVAMFVFSLPFLLFSGYAGFLSDRHGKRNIIVLCKVAEIGVMVLGLLGFLMFASGGFSGLILVLFLMGSQSAFFGPAKYGILPEMLREEDLPRANGIILMTTFLAIIFGTASAGYLKTWTTQGVDEPVQAATQLWVASAVCIGIAVFGTLTSLFIRKVPAARPGLKFHRSALAVPQETRSMLGRDRPLLAALMASSVFWMIAGITQQGVNSLGKVQLGLADDRTSLLVASIGVGIALGAVLAGRLSRTTVDFRLMRIGAWGMVMTLLLLALPGNQAGHLLGFRGSILALIALGMSAGMFAIPLQVFLQARPPEGFKGRMIGVMNQVNFAAILLSSLIYGLFDRILLWAQWPRCTLFLLTALLLLPLAVFYRGASEER